MRAYWFDNLPGDQRLPHDSGKSVSKAHLFNLGIQYYFFPIDDASSLLLSSSSTSSSSSLDYSHSTDTAKISIHADPNLTSSSSSSPSTPTSFDALARSRGYTNCDQVTVSPDTLGEAYESKVRAFFDEHLHEDEEIRYIIDGSGYFDVRAQTQSQIQSQSQSQSQAQAQAKAQATKGSDGEGWIRIKLERGDLIILPAGIYHRFTTDDANYTKAMRLFQDEPKWTPLNRNAETDINAHRLKYLSQRG